jgi:hypothetical protein
MLSHSLASQKREGISPNLCNGDGSSFLKLLSSNCFSHGESVLSLFSQEKEVSLLPSLS